MYSMENMTLLVFRQLFKSLQLAAVASAFTVTGVILLIIWMFGFLFGWVNPAGHMMFTVVFLTLVVVVVSTKILAVRSREAADKLNNELDETQRLFIHHNR